MDDALQLFVAPTLAAAAPPAFGATLNSSLDCHLGMRSPNWSICLQNQRRIIASIDSLPAHLKNGDDLKMKFTSKHPYRDKQAIGRLGGGRSDDHVDSSDSNGRSDGHSGDLSDGTRSDGRSNDLSDGIRSDENHSDDNHLAAKAAGQKYPVRNKRKIRRAKAENAQQRATSSLPTSFRPFGQQPNYSSSNRSNQSSNLFGRSDGSERNSNQLDESGEKLSKESGEKLSNKESSEKFINKQSNKKFTSYQRIEKFSTKKSNEKLISKQENPSERSSESGKPISSGQLDEGHDKERLAQFNRFKSSPAGGAISSISQALFSSSLSSSLSSLFLSASPAQTASSSRSPEPIEVPLVEPLKNNFTLDSKRSNNEQTSDLLSSSLTPRRPAADGRTLDDRLLEGHSLEGRTLEGRKLKGRSLDDRTLEGPTLEGHQLQSNATRSSVATPFVRLIRTSGASSRSDDRSDAFTPLPSTANSSGGEFVNKKFKKGDHLNELAVIDDRSSANRTTTGQDGVELDDVGTLENSTDVSGNSSAVQPPLTYMPVITYKSALLLIGAIFLSLITMLGNMLVMISLIIDRQLRTISNYYLLSLSIADFMIGLISMPLYTLYVVLDRWPLSPLVCDCWLALDYLNSNASVLNLLCISVDRYLSITRPLTYRAKRTAKKAWCWIATTWIISSLLWPPWVFFFPFYEGTCANGNFKFETFELNYPAFELQLSSCNFLC